MAGMGVCQCQFGDVVGLGGYTKVLSFQIGTDNCIQFAFPVLGTATIQQTYSRFLSIGTGGGWSTWKSIDNFGCSTPAALASLLGGVRYLGSVNSSTANSKTETGFYYHSEDIGNSLGWGMLLVLATDSAITQLDIARNGTKCRVSGSSGSDWSSWNS